jgi:nucleoside-diphosphate-sugar epimerase
MRELTHSNSVIQHSVQHDVLDCYMDCSRLQALGWRPRLTWQQAITQVLQHL